MLVPCLSLRRHEAIFIAAVQLSLLFEITPPPPPPPRGPVHPREPFLLPATLLWQGLLLNLFGR